MLYKVGLIIVILSCAFCGGSLMVPVTMAAVGMALMGFGRRLDNGK